MSQPSSPLQRSARTALAVRDGRTGRGAVVVSGTNGKTTTTRLLVAALQASGVEVLSNDTGANLASGVASALASGASGARPVLEVDEAALPRVIADLDPHLVVLNNLSRDQLD